jgi:hypothetical protein
MCYGFFSLAHGLTKQSLTQLQVHSCPLQPADHKVVLLPSQKCILRAKRGIRCGIVVVECLINLLIKRVNLFDYLWIDRFFLLRC